MAQIINTLDDAIGLLNTLYELDDTAPTSGDEDYTVWTGLFNTAINLWETEEGMLWKELFVKLADASDGTKTTTTGNYSYSCPTNFKFPASGYVWLGSNTNKTPVKVIDISEVHLYENNTEYWCYFVLGNTPTLNFNPNMLMPSSQTINYNYYKYATKLTTGTDKFEMSDPMAAVYYALGVLKQEEGDASGLQVFAQKLDAMKTKNTMGTWFQDGNELQETISDGFGY